jgi:O-glycosyl hydrolase
MIKTAQQLSNNSISLFGSAWSAPGRLHLASSSFLSFCLSVFLSFFAFHIPLTPTGWLKTTGNASTGGWLHGKAGDVYHQTWAKYLVKTLQFFHNNGVDFWGV